MENKSGVSLTKMSTVATRISIQNIGNLSTIVCYGFGCVTSCHLGVRRAGKIDGKISNACSIQRWTRPPSAAEVQNIVNYPLLPATLEYEKWENLTEKTVILFLVSRWAQPPRAGISHASNFTYVFAAWISRTLLFLITRRRRPSRRGEAGAITWFIRKYLPIFMLMWNIYRRD